MYMVKNIFFSNDLFKNHYNTTILYWQIKYTTSFVLNISFTVRLSDNQIPRFVDCVCKLIIKPNSYNQQLIRGDC